MPRARVLLQKSVTLFGKGGSVFALGARTSQIKVS